MDSDPGSGQFLGLRRCSDATSASQLKSFKPLPLTPLLLLLLTSLILIAAADASSKHRFLIGEKVNSDNSTSPPPPIKDSPVAIPPPPPVTDDSKNQTLSPPPPLDASDPKNSTKLIPASPVEKPKENPAPKSDEKPSDSDNAPGSASPPPPSRTNNESGHARNVPSSGEGSCDGVSIMCRNEDMVACVTSFDRKSTEALVLVHNLRGNTLKGNLSAENTTVLKIRKHQYQKIKINMGQSKKILIKAGNKECVLQMEFFVSKGNFPIRFPSYEKLVTPINGAYLLIATVIIFGGIWACYLVRRRTQRTGGGVPYQELEMALPESTSATEVVSAEGWDQDWDDDWDGDNAVKSPGHQSISANGLTARSSNKDGWENNWDD